MQHRTRHLPAAVSTVLGLTAPALAAVLLTSPAPTLASPAPALAADTADLAALHAPTFRTAAPAPVAAPKPSPTAVPRVATGAPVRAAAPAPRATASPKATTRTVTGTTPKTTVSQTAQPKGTDDYPYRTQSDFYAVDRWGFTQRQCVSFAAWRLAQHGDTISNDGNVWGSAYSWDEAARKLGHVVTAKPRVGAIAQWNAGEKSAYYAPGSATANGTFTAGGYGHVGWVKQVYNDGSVLIEQYNLGNDRSYSVMRVKAPRYLVIG